MSASMDYIHGRAIGALAALRDVDSQLSSITVTASSPDGAVTVQVDGTCAVIGLELDPKVRSMTGAAVGQVIVATSADAAREVMARRSAILTEFHQAISG